MDWNVRNHSVPRHDSRPFIKRPIMTHNKQWTACVKTRWNSGALLRHRGHGDLPFCGVPALWHFIGHCGISAESRWRSTALHSFPIVPWRTGPICQFKVCPSAIRGSPQVEATPWSRVSKHRLNRSAWQQCGLRRTVYLLFFPPFFPHVSVTMGRQTMAIFRTSQRGGIRLFLKRS